MGDYRFAAERQFVFHVPVGGQSRLVQFGERNATGASTFFTTDVRIAEAIRLTSMFRRGAIKETTIFMPAKPAPAMPAMPAGNAAGTGATAGTVAMPGRPSRKTARTVAAVKTAGTVTKAAQPDGDTAGTMARPAADAAGTMAAAESNVKEENVIEVKNFTQAKEAVSKRLGISKTVVKTPTLLSQVAKEAGLVIKYVE